MAPGGLAVDGRGSMPVASQKRLFSPVLKIGLAVDGRGSIASCISKEIILTRSEDRQSMARSLSGKRHKAFFLSRIETEMVKRVSREVRMQNGEKRWGPHQDQGGLLVLSPRPTLISCFPYF